MLLDGIYVFFEVVAGLAIVFTALWLLTKVLGYVYMLLAGELGDELRMRREQRAGHRHLPTPG